MWTVKQNPVTGARWIEDAEGATVCDFYRHSLHSPSGVLHYPNAKQHAQSVVAAADPTVTPLLAAAIEALMKELRLELGLDDQGNDSDGGQYLSYNQGLEALARLT